MSGKERKIHPSGLGARALSAEIAPQKLNGDWPTGWLRLNRCSRLLGKAPGPPPWHRHSRCSSAEVARQSRLPDSRGRRRVLVGPLACSGRRAARCSPSGCPDPALTAHAETAIRRTLGFPSVRSRSRSHASSTHRDAHVEERVAEKIHDHRVRVGRTVADARSMSHGDRSRCVRDGSRRTLLGPAAFRGSAGLHWCNC